MNTLYPYLNDASFLKEFDRLSDKEQFVNVTVLSWDEQPIQTIHGRISGGGSVNLDGKSAVRRTCNLSLLADAKDNDLANMDNIFAINKKVKIEIGFTNKTKQYQEYDKIWFPLGTFVNINPSVSYSAQGATISMQLKDKMCLLNGEVGGTFPAQTIHDSIEVQDENGNWVIEKIKIYEIIQELVNHWGGEQLGKIIINDIPDQINQVMKWMGNEPIYLIEPDGEMPFYSYENKNGKKFEKGQDIGYQKTDFTYPGELISEPGSSIVDILDKIKNTLGNFEYFYDLDGNFVFQEIKNYLNTEQVTLDLNGLENSDYQVDFYRSKAAYSLEDEMLVTSYSNTPQLNNLKNDFIVWGVQEIGGYKKNIRYHLAIDEKPRYDDIIFNNLVIYTEPSLAPEDIDDFKKNGFKEESYKTHKRIEKVEVEVEKKVSVLDDNGKPVLNEDQTPKVIVVKEKEERSKEIDYINSYSFIGAKAPLIYKNSGLFPRPGQQNVFYYGHNDAKVFMWTYDEEKDEWGYKEQPQLWLSSIKPTDWRTVLYLQGVVAENSGTDSNPYYAELANEWPLLYNIAGVKIDKEYSGKWREDIDLTNVQYFLDFIEGSEELSDIGVKNIGRRSKIVSDDKINCIFEPDVPNLIIGETVDVSKVEYFDFVSKISLYEKEIKMLTKERDAKVKNIDNEISSIKKECSAKIEEETKPLKESLSEKESISKELQDKINDKNVELSKFGENLSNEEKAKKEEVEGALAELTESKNKVDEEIASLNKEIEAITLSINNYYNSDRKPFSINDKESEKASIIDDYQKLIDVKEDEKAQLTEDDYEKVTKDISNLVTGGTSNPAFLRIRDLLWEHTSYNQSVTINALPVYHLEPNTRIALRNSETGIYGDYIINSMALPLDISGTMSLNCTKALDKI